MPGRHNKIPPASQPDWDPAGFIPATRKSLDANRAEDAASELLAETCPLGTGPRASKFLCVPLWRDELAPGRGGRMWCRGRTWTAGPGGQVAVLLFIFLKNRGFGKEEVSNFTKSFSVLSGFFFRGLKVLLLPYASKGQEAKRDGHTKASCQAHAHREKNEDSEVEATGGQTHSLVPDPAASCTRTVKSPSAQHSTAQTSQVRQSLPSGHQPPGVAMCSHLHLHTQKPMI